MTEPSRLEAQVERHLAWLEARGYAATTIEGRRRDLLELVRWCAERSIDHPTQLNREVLDAFQRWLSRRPKKDGAPLSRASQGVKLSAVAGFGRWLARERLVVANPAAELELPKRPSRLPKAVLTPEEAEQVLAVPDVTTLLGLRNRAILQTFYATGVRRSELVGLDVADVDLGRGVLAVRQGKGKPCASGPLLGPPTVTRLAPTLSDNAHYPTAPWPALPLAKALHNQGLCKLGRAHRAHDGGADFDDLVLRRRQRLRPTNPQWRVGPPVGWRPLPALLTGTTPTRFRNALPSSRLRRCARATVGRCPVLVSPQP